MRLFLNFQTFEGNLLFAKAERNTADSNILFRLFRYFCFLIAFKLKKMFEEGKTIKVVNESLLILIHGNVLN